MILVAKYPLSWLAHRCTPLNWNPGGCAFCLICPCHELSMAGPIGALYLVTIHWPWQGTNVFLGSVSRTWGRKEISFFFCWPWTWWVPGSRSIKGACQTLEKQGADKQKGLLPRWWVTLQKTILFLRWTGVFYWQGPFNGCLHVKFGEFENFLDLLTQYDVLGLYGLVSDGKDLYLN